MGFSSVKKGSAPFRSKPFHRNVGSDSFFYAFDLDKISSDKYFHFYFLSVLGSAGFISSSISSSGVKITVVSPRFLWLNVM